MTVEISKKIREALKTAGYGKADVSVYNKGYSMGSTVYVTIKRAEVALDKIEPLCHSHERVHRDDATGEILGGGNCFVDVRYEHDVLKPHEARAQDQFMRGRRQFGPFTIRPGRDPWTMTIWRDDGEGGSPGLNVEADSPGGGLARTLAAAGLLEVLDEIEFTVDPAADAANDAGEPAEPVLTRDELDAAERAEAVNTTLAALAARQREAAPLLDPLPRLPGERDDDYSERLVRRIVRAAERWKAACPCPPWAADPRLHALWCAVERLVANDEGRAPFIEGDQG